MDRIDRIDLMDGMDEMDEMVSGLGGTGTAAWDGRTSAKHKAHGLSPVQLPGLSNRWGIGWLVGGWHAPLNVR